MPKFVKDPVMQVAAGLVVGGLGFLATVKAGDIRFAGWALLVLGIVIVLGSLIEHHSSAIPFTVARRRRPQARPAVTTEADLMSNAEKLASDLSEQRRVVQSHLSELERILGPRPIPPAAKPAATTREVKEWETLWRTDGSKDKRGRLNVEGPFCPKDLCALAYGDALDFFSLETTGKTIGGEYDGYLVCPECATRYDWDASKTVNGELEVEDGRDQARVRLEAAIRRDS